MTPYRQQQPFYLSRFADPELTGIFAVARLWFESAPALSISLGGCLSDELSRRVWNVSASDQSPREPELLDLHFSQWSDRDVSDAVRLLTVVSYILTAAKIGELIDHLMATLAEIAGERLAASSDPRNAVHYCERLQAEEGQRHDPSTN